MQLDDSLVSVRGVGSSTLKNFEKLHLTTVGDLLHYWPRKYSDFSNVTPIAKLTPGAQTVRARISSAQGRYARRGLHITEAIARDDTGAVRLVWFSQPYRAASLDPTQDYFVTGEFSLKRSRFQMTNPTVEKVSDFTTQTARIVPTYSETKGLNSSMLRKFVAQILPVSESIAESLPSWLLVKHSLMPLPNALRAMHFPDNAEEQNQAQYRMEFQELFELSLASRLYRAENIKSVSLPITFDLQAAKKFVSHIPFPLTDAQRRAVWRIYQDMEAGHPMNRLIEGDVGSGKTVVAAMAALMVLHANLQVVLLAPTEILARQHAATINNLFDHTEFAGSIGLLVGSLKAAQKKLLKQRVQDKTVRFLIGTHAVLEDDLDIKHMGLIIVDEQHRFGVRQRQKLLSKTGHMPHMLHMSATPIPRSLALTLFGELDITRLDELPKGRQPITTQLLASTDRRQLYAAVKEQIKQGRQVYWICPSIESELVGRNVGSVYDEVKRAFPKVSVGLLHGKLKASEKESGMADFVSGKYSILVATTVIEVGVDVPNASVMVIESAERFGLAQIHQLRGRVGRGKHASYCYLMPTDDSQPRTRLKALERIKDGFALAELDLRMRGPGALYGIRQHGELDLRLADFANRALILKVRQAVDEFITRNEKVVEYRELARKVTRLRSITHLN